MSGANLALHKNLELYEARLALAFNWENANKLITGCNHLLTATVVLATISLCVRNTRVKVKVTVDRRCRGRDNTKCNDRQSYRATLRFTGSIFSFLAYVVIYTSSVLESLKVGAQLTATFSKVNIYTAMNKATALYQRNKVSNK